MYVKIFNAILDSSLAENRKLRHFFIDLLLCSDPDGNVIKTNNAIVRATGADLEEVEWGLAELQKPDPASNHPECEGRRIIPLEGHGYGWKIVNYQYYRDLKSSKELRASTAERVRQWRERQKAKMKRRYPKAHEDRFVKSIKNGEPESVQDSIVADSLNRE